MSIHRTQVTHSNKITIPFLIIIKITSANKKIYITNFKIVYIPEFSINVIIYYM